MTDATTEQLTKYAAALKEYLRGGGEPALQRAYELGRAALAEGVGVLEMAALHHRAMVQLLRSEESLPGMVGAAGQFLVESLSPFEMTHRGYREANASLEASEKQYRELFENANDAVFTADLTGQFTSINRAGEQLTGYERGEVTSMNFASVVVPEHVPIAQRMMERKLRGEVERTRYEIEIKTRDGRRVPVEVHTALLRHDGQAVGIHGIARDITERKQAEETLRWLNERLEDEAKRIAHALHDEAGQLLSSVHLALEEVARDLPQGARARMRAVKELLDQIEEELRRLSHELRPTVLDDLGLLPALEFLADRVGRRSGLTITVQDKTERRLPPSVETALYRSVQEAFNNIMRHAKAARVKVEIRQEAGSVLCSVRDDGIGFNTAVVKVREGERGLGLMGIRERAGALGGTLEIRSAPGKGTELSISIPLESGDVAADSAG